MKSKGSNCFSYLKMKMLLKSLTSSIEGKKRKKKKGERGILTSSFQHLGTNYQKVERLSQKNVKRNQYSLVSTLKLPER